MGLRELLSHQPLFNQYVRARRHALSCYHFSSIFLWKDFFQFDFKVIDGYLCVIAKHAFGSFLYLPPLGGDLNASIVRKCFDHLNAANAKKSFSRIENVSQEDLKHFDPARYRWIEKSKEYCYRKEDLIGLKGNKFKSKRSSYNRFAKNNRYEVHTFDRGRTKDCIQLYELWARNRKQGTQDEIYHAMLDENRLVHALIFEYFDEIGLQGMMVSVDQKPQAYTFGYPLNDDTFCVLVEITNLDIKGLSVFIFSHLCRDKSLSQYQYINVMDDFAMDNVAKTKQSFHPAALYPSYVVMERE